MRYLHIMHNEKFNTDYIEFLEKNFNIEEHSFIFLNGVERTKIPILKRNNIVDLDEKYKINMNKGGLIKKIKLILGIFYILRQIIKKENKKVFFHGLFNQYLVLSLILIPWSLKKCNWLIWGGDLYSYKNRNYESFKRKVLYKIEDYIKGNFGGYVTHVEGDYELAKQWYGAEGKYYDCFMYPSNLYKNIEVKKIEKNEIYIQIGNSADSSNNHLEILDKLEKFKEENIKLFCILSYGDKKWADKVIEYGKEKFGEKFIPITEFMKFDEYLNFISKIDIAIFAHNRQQGFGNIVSLLGIRKTVYLKKEVTTYRTLKKNGVIVGCFEELNCLSAFSDIELENNVRIIKERFSEERLLKDIKSVLN